MEDEIVIKSEILFDEGVSNNAQPIESNGKRSRCPKTKRCQYKKIISFIDEQSNYKGSIYARQKLSSEQWQRLTLELNAIGPPQHTTEEWKKVWTDFKGKRNRNKKDHPINMIPMDPLDACVVSTNEDTIHNEDSKVAESQYECWTITDQSNDTLTQSNFTNQEQGDITTTEHFRSEILNKIDLVIGEQARLHMKMDLLMEQQLRLQESVEKIIKSVEEKGCLPK